MVDLWRRIIQGKEKTWVLFENGTCVILMQPSADPAAQAIELLKEWGPVHAGTPSGDFTVISLADAPGSVVTCHHPDILTYVEEEGAPEPVIGLIGRQFRDDDARELTVVHVESQSKG